MEEGEGCKKEKSEKQQRRILREGIVVRGRGKYEWKKEESDISETRGLMTSIEGEICEWGREMRDVYERKKIKWKVGRGFGGELK